MSLWVLDAHCQGCVLRVEGREVRGAAAQSLHGGVGGAARGLVPAPLLPALKGQFEATSLIYMIIMPLEGARPGANHEGDHQ